MIRRRIVSPSRSRNRINFSVSATRNNKINKQNKLAFEPSGRERPLLFSELLSSRRSVGSGSDLTMDERSESDWVGEEVWGKRWDEEE
jgi:hypothetical protein